MTRRPGRKLQGVGLALLVVLAGCALPRRGTPGSYALDMDSVSATTRHQPSLVTQVAGEEQVVNPAWLAWGAAAVATTAAVVTVVELTPQQRTDF